MAREYVLKPFGAAMNFKIDYARELNEQQHAAVTAPPGPSLVIAGAGSGKTRTLTYRVAYLIEQGIPADRILLLTFTNKAAREMMRRVADLLGSELSSLWGGTFHSVGNRLLRQHARRIGYQPDFTIMDREDARDLINACLGDAQIDVAATRFPKADVLADIFSLAVNKEVPVQTVLTEQYDYFEPLAPQIHDIQTRYQERKRSTNAMDFDDLLVLWLKMLRDNPDLCEHYQRRFQFILVDEYQDTNKLQGDIIDLLGARHHNVMVVGDDSQSIYSWRGADFQNILHFPDRYPGTMTYKIEANYRSTPEILNLANAAIATNVRQFRKQLMAMRASGTKPLLVTCETAAEQSAFICQRVLELRDEGIELSNMAVLYRSHFHTMELQMELTRRNIPFSITSGVRFFEKAHIKDLACYLRLVINPRDELAFKRLARLMPGIGGKSADKLWTRFSAAWAAAQPPGEELQPDPLPDPDAMGEAEASFVRPRVVPSAGKTIPHLAIALQSCAAAVPKKTAASWAQFTATMAQLEGSQVRASAALMIRVVIEAGYKEYLQENHTDYRSRMEDLETLMSFAQGFPSPEELLSQLALMTNMEAEEDRTANRDTEQLKLSTIHQAKGLEFDVVFVIMLCEGMFPSERSLNTPAGDEEERRLFYVALTRAKNELYLSYPLLRLTAYAAGDARQQPSRFLGELPRDMVEECFVRPSYYG